jgi:predicted enzyme related to lactoylglutathione lyase
MPKRKSRTTARKRSKPAPRSTTRRSGSRAAKPGARAQARPATRAQAAAGRRPVARPARPRTAAPAAVPNDIGLVNHHADYTSHDMDAVKRFYTELLGFRDAQHDPQMNYLMVRTGPSSSLGFMPPMPGPPEQWRPPREPALYFMVEDVDRAHRTLVDRGVNFDQPPMDMPWGHRVAVLRDPEGRRVYLAQVAG